MSAYAKACRAAVCCACGQSIERQDSPLSDREMDVLSQLSEGKVYKQIAQDLGLSASTVRTHLHNIYGKIGAIDRAQAVLIAMKNGWL